MGTSAAEAEIRARIGARGRITFAEFMETALYHSGGGYYSSGSLGRAPGDYFTSTTAHPAFGALLAVLLMRMWDAMERPSPFYAVEMGAGTGRLARDILDYARSLPGQFGDTLRYVAVDRVPSLGGLGDALPTAHALTAAGLPLKLLDGCFLSNELLDAFPVHRFQVQDGAIKEVYVALRDGEFVEVIDKPSTPGLAGRIDALGVGLPDGFRGEVNLEIGPWVDETARALRRGFVLTIDYGYESAELYSAERAGGTLQTYYDHTQSASPYKRIGRQDLTAHVDFSAVRSEGRGAGLNSVALLTQSQLMRALGIETWLDGLRSEDLGQSQRDANAMAMRELIRPDGLGAFKVLLQEKGTRITRIDSLIGAGSAVNDAELPIPLLRETPLLGSRYPHALLDLEELWPDGQG